MDRLGHLVEIGVDDLDHARGGLGLGEAREAAQVGEEHRAVALDAAEAQVPARHREHLVDDAAGDEAREQVAHAFALDRLGHVQDRQRPQRAERQREQRIHVRDDPSAVERELDRDREQRRQRHGLKQRAPAAGAQRAER